MEMSENEFFEAVRKKQSMRDFKTVEIPLLMAAFP
jgi:hypothetical protein